MKWPWMLRKTHERIMEEHGKANSAVEVERAYREGYQEKARRLGRLLSELQQRPKFKRRTAVKRGRDFYYA